MRGGRSSNAKLRQADGDESTGAIGELHEQNRNPLAHHRLAVAAAKNAALLCGLKAFNGMTQNLKVTKSRQSQFETKISTALNKLGSLFPEKVLLEGDSFVSREQMLIGQGMIDGSEDSKDLAFGSSSVSA